MLRAAYFETFGKDLQYAVRSLARVPGFTVVIVLTLALGIGANSAIFSVIEGVLLRPLPYAKPEQLVRIYYQSDAQPKFPLNPYDFHDFRERTRAFSGMAAMTRRDLQLSGSGEPVRLRAFQITARYFEVLGIRPARGREFSSADELPGHQRSVILSDRVWRTRFAADAALLNRQITLDAQAFTVIGIMPPGTQHPGNNYNPVADGETVDLWCPFSFDEDPNQRGSHYLDVLARLRSGVSPAQGETDLRAMLAQIKKEHGEKGWRVYLVPLLQETVGRTRQTLWVLLAAVGLLLLIACVNAANLLLARASARAGEIAVRSALGAARGRIVRQLLTESLLIALAGGALGTFLAVGGVSALRFYLPAGFPRAAEIRLDPTVFAFTLAVALLTGVVFGLVPALTASRLDLLGNLRESGRGATGGKSQIRLRSLLVAGEIGLACVLLTAAGLLLHSFVNLLGTDPGFRPQQVLTASIAAPLERYRTDELRIRFYDRLVAGMESFPGVTAVGVGSDLPWTGYDGNADGYSVEGRPAAFNEKTTARYHNASPGYFRALGIPLREGRFFDDRDGQNASTVIIVNDTMAKRYWPGEDAIGKRISFRSRPAEKDWFRIVGIVGDVRDQADSGPARPALWFPYKQQPDRGVFLVVRADSDLAAVAVRLRGVLRDLDPRIAVGDLRLMKGIADASRSGKRFALLLVALFAALALALAGIGIYGVLSYSVNRRMHEFGMRMALGAKPADLIRLIVGDGLKLCLPGMAAGLLCALLVSRFLESLLYGVAGRDPVTFVSVAALALGSALLACYLPARRAAKTDPMISLRAE